MPKNVQQNIIMIVLQTSFKIENNTCICLIFFKKTQLGILQLKL